jgi:hypothetical protein
MNRRSNVSLSLRVILAMALAAAPAPPAIAEAVSGMLWTSVASAGTVDEGDLDAVSLDGAVAQHAGAAGQTVTIRYNVVAVDGLSVRGILMTAKFRDSGDSTQVVLTLKRHSLLGGGTSTVLTLDSNDFLPSPSFQTRQVDDCSADFDFVHNAYYIEAQLVRRATSVPSIARPALSALQLAGTIC